MKLIVSNKNKPPRTIDYPWLGIANIGEYNKELIVLFVAESRGVVLSANSVHKQGSYRYDWYMDDFVIFEGDITLKND